MKQTKFSVALGLFDYINPLFYAITTSTIIINMKDVMPKSLYIMFIVGAVISMIFGLTIPTVKLLAGLGKFEFKMPVNLVFYVNCGILISSIALINSLKEINTLIFIFQLLLVIALLTFIVYKTKKFNTAAVLTGAVGYVIIYKTMITLAIQTGVTISIVLYAIAILFFLLLIMIGIKANLKDAKIHWIIETCNICCQMFVAIATVLLLK